MRIGAFILKESGKYAATLSKFAYVYIYTARKGHIYRLIPSFLLPFRHYCAEEVASSVCNEHGQCTSASDSTIDDGRPGSMRTGQSLGVKAAR